MITQEQLDAFNEYAKSFMHVKLTPTTAMRSAYALAFIAGWEAAVKKTEEKKDD